MQNETGTISTAHNNTRHKWETKEYKFVSKAEKCNNWTREDAGMKKKTREK